MKTRFLLTDYINSSHIIFHKAYEYKHPLPIVERTPDYALSSSTALCLRRAIIEIQNEI